MELLVDWMEIMYRFIKDQYNKKSDQRNEYIETNNNQPIQDRKNQLDKESIPSVRIGDDDGNSSACENDPRGRRTKIVEETIPSLPNVPGEDDDHEILIGSVYGPRIKIAKESNQLPRNDEDESWSIGENVLKEDFVSSHGGRNVPHGKRKTKIGIVISNDGAPHSSWITTPGTSVVGKENHCSTGDENIIRIRRGIRYLSKMKNCNLETGATKQSVEEKNEIGKYADNTNFIQQAKFSEDQIAEIDTHVQSLPPAQKSLKTRKQIVDLPEVGSCDTFIITSTGATLNHSSRVLGTYQKNGVSNGRDSYKNDKDNDCHLHFTPINNWMVSTEASKDTTTGYIHSCECGLWTCTNWSVWNGNAWEEDATLSVQRKDKQIDAITRSEAIEIFEADPERIEIEESVSAASTSNDDYLNYCMKNPDS